MPERVGRSCAMIVLEALVASWIGFAVATSAVAQNEPTAGEIYKTHCAFCHGVEGKGDGVAGDALNPKPTDFTSAELWKSATPEKLTDTITNGRPGTAMVPFKKTLTEKQIAALVEYLKTFAPK